ncbi:carboxypeptidase-like regulatory domain-containing protein [Rhodocytophaga aerolata]|uniref:Carboxypeptidase-like regulatory domain-containing protein n=1 Tax=Rhodocytophaga aerolata TaxID=455078 RepID=A0ABT8QYB1_9BACT|nr:carboxypeptidase-like regulatory domain-containing protein [Rhodocytophaga aerolata]MDO1444825.1 carboxypeptidase-like regulatory domain-containing protein [Rhodocytophaga aerolata]
MKLFIQSVLFILFILAAIQVNAQQQPANKIQLSGYILNKEDAAPIPGVHVLNNKSKIGAISDDKGYFSIAMNQADTILFSAIGYETHTLILDASTNTINPLVEIRLSPKTYQLQEVDVRAIPTEERFKKDFLALELPDQPQLGLPQIRGQKLADGIYTIPTGGIAISGPFSFFYNKLSREAKEIKKANSLFSAEARKKVYDSKFNAQLVQRVTGLKDKDLEEFMKYCKLSEAQVVNAQNEYEIVVAINDCYKSFKETRNMN